MTALEDKFEADLRFKVDIKCPSGQQEERFLVKSFQFFDFRRAGMIDFNQFIKTLERIGVIITKAKAEQLFYYVIDIGYGQDGFLDYKSYSKKVYNPASQEMYDNQVHKPLSTAAYDDDYQKHQMSQEVSQASENSPGGSIASHSRRRTPMDITPDTVESIMEELRQRIKTRSAKGFVGLQRQFKMVDKSNSGTVNQFEFSKVLREYDLNLLDNQYNVIFHAFDRFKNGQVDYLTFKSISLIFNDNRCING
jgi:Ca2+-binding EF-hand superfamily protein